MRKLLHSLRNLHRRSPSAPQNPFFLPPKTSTNASSSCYYTPSPSHSSPPSTHSIFSSSFRSWPAHNPALSSSLRLLARPMSLKRLISTTHFPIFLRNLSGGSIRLFQFSLQKRAGLGTYRWMGNARRWFMSTPDGVLHGLIGANVAVFFLWRVADPIFMQNHFTISLDNVKSWRLHTLITSAFSQMDSNHIFTNMLGLYFFGDSIGKLFGPQFLLKMYFAGAVGGSIFYLVSALLSRSSKGMRSMYRSEVPGLGASGAVNAIMLFYIFLFPKSTIYFSLFVPLPAALVGAILIGSDLWRVKKGDTHVSGAAHLGGAVVAALVWARMIKHWI